MIASFSAGCHGTGAEPGLSTIRNCSNTSWSSGIRNDATLQTFVEIHADVIVDQNVTHAADRLPIEGAAPRLSRNALGASPITSTFRMTASCNFSDAMNLSRPGKMKRVMRWHRSGIWSRYRHYPSQWLRLAKDPVAHVPVKGSLGPDMDLHAQQFLEVLDQ